MVDKYCIYIYIELVSFERKVIASQQQLQNLHGFPEKTLIFIQSLKKKFQFSKSTFGKSKLFWDLFSTTSYTIIGWVCPVLSPQYCSAVTDQNIKPAQTWTEYLIPAQSQPK